MTDDSDKPGDHAARPRTLPAEVPQSVMREILTELLLAATRPRALAGLVFCCAVVATSFPLIVCPCSTIPAWLFPLSTTGCVVWFGAASFLAVGSTYMEERVVWVVFTLAAPLAYVFVLAGFVPR